MEVMKMVKLFKCSLCGNIVEMVHVGGGTLVCCGKEMDELKPNTVDAAQEKHVPVAEVSGSKVVVKVGSVEHPMTEEHYIAYIWLETDKGVQKKALAPGQKPEAEFALAEGEKPVAVYEYCTLHGFWKSEL